MITYADLASEVERFAGFLRDAGVGPGDVVLSQMPNRREALVLSWTAFHLGCVLAPVVDIYREHELTAIVPMVTPEAVIAVAEHRDERCAEALDAVLAACARSRACGSSSAARPRAGRRGSRRPRARPPLPPHPGYLDAPVARPVHLGNDVGAEGRRAQRAHADGRVAPARASAYGVTWRDRVHDPYPLAHIAGLEYATTISALTGSTVLLSRMTGQRRAAREVVEHGATYAAGPTGMVPLLVEEFRAAGVERAPRHTFVCGGTTVPRVLIEQAEAVGIGAMRVYGLTEQPSRSPPRAPATRPATATRPTARSRRAPSASRSTRRRASRSPPGVEGELRVRGPERMLGYVDPAQTPSLVDEEGWFYTGDLGVVDERGYVHDHRADQGHHQPRRREVLARARSRTSSGPPGGAKRRSSPPPDERLRRGAAAFIVARRARRRRSPAPTSWRRSSAARASRGRRRRFPGTRSRPSRRRPSERSRSSTSRICRCATRRVRRDRGPEAGGRGGPRHRRHEGHRPLDRKDVRRGGGPGRGHVRERRSRSGRHGRRAA